MRILHLVGYSLYSGPVPATVGLCLAQRALGHQVCLAHDTKRGAFNAYEEAAAPRLKGLDLEPPIALTLSAKSTPLELWRDVRALRRHFSEDPPDVVHVHLSHDHSVSIFARSDPKKTVRVRTFHASRSFRRRVGQGWTNRRADGWIVRSESDRQTLLASHPLQADRVQVIPAGIDAARFQPPSSSQCAEARRRFGLPADATVVGHVALLASRGQQELLAAAEALQDERLWLLFVGRGEHENHLRDLVRTSPMVDRIVLTGYLENEALHMGYAAMDGAFVGRLGNDASGRPALEAMASGVAVAGHRQGALASLLESGRGFPIEELSTGAICEALTGLLDSNARRRCAEAARQWVERARTFEVEAAETVSLYERLLTQR